MRAYNIPTDGSREPIRVGTDEESKLGAVDWFMVGADKYVGWEILMRWSKRSDIKVRLQLNCHITNRHIIESRHVYEHPEIHEINKRLIMWK